MIGSKPKIILADAGSPKILSATGLQAPMRQPLHARHRLTRSIQFVPGEHRYPIILAHQAQSLKYVLGSHTAITQIIVLHTAETIKLVPGIHSANILFNTFNTDKSDTSGRMVYFGNRVTGAIDALEVGCQTTKVLLGNAVDGVVDKVYYEFEVVKNLVGAVPRGISVGIGNDFYLTGASMIGSYDSQGNYQGGSGGDTFTDGDVVRVAWELGDMDSGSGGVKKWNVWFAINGGSWVGGGDPALGTSPLVILGLYAPHAIRISFEVPFANPDASEILLLEDSGDHNYSAPAGFTALGSSPRYDTVLRDTDMSAYPSGYTLAGSVTSTSLAPNYTYRCVIPAASLSNGPASQVAALPIIVAGGAPVITEMWIGHKGAGSYDFDGSQVQIRWWKGHAKLYPSGPTFWAEDWSDITSFAFDHTKDLVISWYQQTTPQVYRSVAPGGNGFVRRSGNFAGTTSGAGFSPFVGNYFAGIRELALIA